MARGFDRGVLIGIGLLGLLVVANAVISYLNTQNVHNDARSVAHSQEVLAALRTLRGEIVQMEIAQRNFVLKGDGPTSDAYTTAKNQSNQQIDRLKVLTQDNADQQKRIEELNAAFQAASQKLDKAVDVRRKDGYEPARQVVIAGVGEGIRTPSETLISHLEQAETTLLVERNQATDKAYADSLLYGTASALFGLTAIGLLMWQLARSERFRERAAAAVREQREWFRTTLGSIGDAVIATDNQSNVTFLNPIAEQLTGWSLAEATGKPLSKVFEIINESSRLPVENPAHRALRDGTIVGLANHTLLIARDGTERPIDDSAAPIRDEKGVLGGAVLVFRDITERKQADSERLRLTERLRLALASADLGTWEWEPETDSMSVSARAAELYGLDKDQVYKREALRELIHVDHRDRVRNKAAQAVLDRADYDVEYPITRPLDGKVIWIAAIGRGVYDESGRLLRMLGVVQDISVRRRATETYAQLAAIVESSEDAIVSKTLEGKIVSWNAGAERIFGYTAQEAIGQSISLVIPPDRMDEERTILARLCRGERIKHFETVRVTKNGQFVDISLTISPLRDGEGKVIGASKVARDITEKKRAETALRQSEERFRAIVEASPECVKLVAPDGTLLQMNSAGLEMVEADESALGHCVYKVIAPEFRDAYREFNERICRGERGSLQFDIVGLRGTRRHMESNAVPLRSPSGEFSHLAVTRDVTARRVAESERERLLIVAELERRRLEEVFRLAPSFMAVLRGPDHIFERANDRYHDLVQRQNIIGKSVREALPEVVDQGFIEVLNTVYQTGEPFIGTDIIVELNRNGDGHLEEVMVDFVYQPLRGTTGEVSGILVQGIDLTLRKRTEEALRLLRVESERRKRLYETILTNIPDLIYVFDLEHRFTYANETLLNMWGMTWEEAIGKTCLELGYEPWHASMHDEEIEKVRATKKPIRGEVPFSGTQGRRIYDYIFFPVLGADGAVEAVAGTTRDVTERQRMEQNLRDDDRKKDDFIALLAHELRNPLAPIRNGLQVIRLSDDREIRDRAQKMMDRQLSHMVRLVDDLLDVSRIGRNKMELRRNRVALSEVISSAVETAKPTLDEAGHQLTITIPSEPLFLIADLTRLAQVFSNLLTNSAKYTSSNGHIWLTAERHQEQLHISVRDNGIGIPLESQANIFDMFAQVDRPNERTTGGLGIGLAIVKGLVEMHGGTVSVSSEGQGKGSSFEVRLPIDLNNEPAAEVLHEADRMQELSRRRVLVVDDNRDGAESMAMMLSLGGDEVLTAHDGLEAIALTESFRPEIILMDVGMPKLGGLEATRRIRQQAWGKNIIIIALTGWGKENDREQSKLAGCDGHLVKPVNIVDLQQMLSDLSAQSKSTD